MTKILNITRQYGSFFPKKRQRKETFSFTIPPGEVFHSGRLTILDTHLGGIARLESMPDPGRTGRGEITVAWECPGSADVRFQVEAFSSPDGSSAATSGVTRQMTGFSPSRHGWPFDNRFAAIPPFKLIGELRYGDASKGLCGGMVYSALDYFMAGLELPAIPEKYLSQYRSPVEGPIFDYFGKRLFHSFDLPGGVWNYIELMHPDYPDCQPRRRSSLHPAPRSRAWRVIRQEWPAIKSSLDLGQPCPLGLVHAVSKNVKDLGKNHQVLAYGYELTGDDLKLFIYDPNRGDPRHKNRDDLTLELNIGSPDRRLEIKFWENKAVHCFFKTNYTYSNPPAQTSTPGRIILFEEENFCGRSIDIVQEHPDLSAHKMGNFNNRTSSFVILSGVWNFYLDAGFHSPVLHKNSPLTLGPGNYKSVSDLGIQDDEVTSIRVVSPGK